METQDKQSSTLKDLLIERLFWCLNVYEGEERGIKDVESLDLSRAYTKHNCGKKRIVERCWSDVVAMSSVCLNETQNNTVGIVEEALRNALDYGCTEGGRYLAYVLLKELNIPSSRKTNVIQECVGVAKQGYEEVGFHVDAARVLAFYQQLKVFKGCLVEKMLGDNTAVYSVHTFLSLMQRGMKCLDPGNGNVVLCEMIDPRPSTGVEVCPLVGVHENEPPEYVTFIDLGFMCLRTSTENLDRVDGCTTIQECRMLFGSFCHNRLSVHRCVGGLSSISENCQNRTNHQMLTIFTDLIGTTLEIGCKQDGEVLANLVHRFIKDGAETGIESGQVRVCLNTAVGQLKNAHLSVDTGPTKSMLTYWAFESINECFGSDVGPVKTAFILFINEILQSLECIHPVNGMSVLCKNTCE